MGDPANGKRGLGTSSDNGRNLVPVMLHKMNKCWLSKIYSGGPLRQTRSGHYTLECIKIMALFCTKDDVIIVTVTPVSRLGQKLF